MASAAMSYVPWHCSKVFGLVGVPVHRHEAVSRITTPGTTNVTPIAVKRS
jgi:hypothetical protein